AYRRLQRPSSAHTHQGIHQTPYNTKITINKKLKTKKCHYAKSHNKHTRACYKDAHAHYATTNHHTNTTTNQQNKQSHQPATGSNRQASVRMPNSPPNQHHPKHKQALKPAYVPSVFFTCPKQETKQKPVNPNSSLIQRFSKISLERR
ncbi:hypothetical protein ACRQEF_09220, partial [Actinotignum sp. GS-2025a]|uniref:hypothetical protein n=1 Tax=Actinotignum sp. GS-2025a TaxID=3427274 RepID=UPI003F462811